MKTQIRKEWYEKVEYGTQVFGDYISYDIKSDDVILRIDEPISDWPTDRRREELRKTKEGFYYLHTDNDRENEKIITSGLLIKGWADAHEITL